MTPSELRAAAERIKRIRAGVEKSQDIYGVPVRRDPTRMESIEAGNKVKRLMLDDERALVEYAIESLATVWADDAELWTEEWVASLNPPRYWEAGREYSWPTIGLRFACELAGVSGVGEPGFYIDGRYEPLYLKHVKTRGQVRALLRALGAERKETT